MNATILDEAASATSGPRQADYGHPAESLGNTARLWNAYLAGRKNPGAAIDGGDVARMMILVKLARDAHASKRDNWVDIAGYARCLEQLSARERLRLDSTHATDGRVKTPMSPEERTGATPTHPIST